MNLNFVENLIGLRVYPKGINIEKTKQKITSEKQLSNNYAPCFNRIDFVLIPSCIELPFLQLLKQNSYFQEHQMADWLSITKISPDINPPSKKPTP